MTLQLLPSNGYKPLLPWANAWDYQTDKFAGSCIQNFDYNQDQVDAADPLLDRSRPHNWPSSHPGLLHAQEESEGKFQVAESLL